MSERCADFIVVLIIFYLKDGNAAWPRLRRLAKCLSYPPCSSRLFTDDKGVRQVGEILADLCILIRSFLFIFSIVLAYSNLCALLRLILLEKICGYDSVTQKKRKRIGDSWNDVNAALETLWLQNMIALRCGTQRILQVSIGCAMMNLFLTCRLYKFGCNDRFSSWK